MEIGRSDPLATAIGTKGPVWLLFCGILLLALAGRLTFVFTAPFSGGDWILYADVAHNILRGCGIAITDPATGACLAHFGANQLPLFPIFVAGVQFVFGPSDVAVRVVQSVVASLSTAWLAVAVLRLTGSNIVAATVGGVQSLSLVQDYWAATLLTETLALATTQWVLAELLLSFAAARIRIVPLTLALTAAVWTRMDGILLMAPVAIGLVITSGWLSGLRKLAIIVLVVGGSCGLWSVRNLAVGISPWPTPWVLLDGTLGPLGYLAWLKTWTLTPDQRANSSWFGTSDYSRIQIDPTAYRDDEERQKVEALLNRLNLASGHPFPKEIDDGFARLAEQRRATQGVQERLRRDVVRAWGLTVRWIWPWSGAAYDGGARVSKTDSYRFLLTCGFIFATLRAIFVGPSVLRAVVGITVAYILVRVTFFAVTWNLEARYMIELAPFIETAAALCVGLLAAPHFARWAKRRS